MAKKSIAATKTAKRRAPEKRAEPLTIYDREKYFDATFSEKEREELRDKIMQELGFADQGTALIKVYDLLGDAEDLFLEKLHKYVASRLEIYPRVSPA